MLRISGIALSLFALFESRLLAQDWTAVQALPPSTSVRITELGGTGREIRGKISAVDDTQLTLLRGDKIVTVPRSAIARIDQQRRDPIWEGLVLGALFAAAMRVAFADEACRSPDPQCTTRGIALGAAAGALIDFQIRGYRRVYDAPATTVTLLRFSF